MRVTRAWTLIIPAATKRADKTGLCTACHGVYSIDVIYKKYECENER
jgi:hypothetical protein